jgi:hypothetical protein
MDRNFKARDDGYTQFLISSFSSLYIRYSHSITSTTFNPKVLQRPNFGLCCFGHLAMIRRCELIFWEFYGK